MRYLWLLFLFSAFIMHSHLSLVSFFFVVVVNHVHVLRLLSFGIQVTLIRFFLSSAMDFLFADFRVDFNIAHAFIVW